MNIRIARPGIIPVALLLFYLQAAMAQDYPTRPITLVIPFAPGGGADIIPRLLTDGMARTLGRPIIVDNRPGAAGTIGTAAVARAQPDGYTLLATVSPTIVLNVYLQKNVPYDPRTAFEPVSLLAGTPILLVATPSLGAANVADLIAYARKNPGQVTYGTPGVGTGQHILGEVLKKNTGINMVHVPYKSTGQMMQELMSGEIKLALTTPPAAVPLAQAGKVRIIAVADEARLKDMPDVPTIHETVPGAIFYPWYGIFAPRGTPRPIVERINAAVMAELNNPETVAKYSKQGVFATPQGPDGLRKLVNTELDRWAREIPAIGIQPE